MICDYVHKNLKGVAELDNMILREVVLITSLRNFFVDHVLGKLKPFFQHFKERFLGNIEYEFSRILHINHIE